MIQWIGTLFTAWIFTVVIESMIAYLCKIRRKEDFLLLLLMNTVTNPLAMLLYQLLGMHLPLPDLTFQIFVEILVIISEAQILKKYMEAEPSPWGISLALNAGSYFAGLAVTLLI